MGVFAFLVNNWDAILTLLVAIIAVAKVTAWGRANAAALQLIVDVIEKLHLTEVKGEVARRQGDLPDIAQDALTDAVATADAKKTPLAPVLRLVREGLRGLLQIR